MEPILIAQPGPGAAAPANDTHALSSSPEVASEPVLPVVLRRLDEDQAVDVVTIDLDGKSDIADAMVVASGRSQRHVGAIADKLARDLKDAGYGTIPVEGLPAADWVLLDAGDVIVHLFRPEVRSFYKLERIWAPESFPPEGDDVAVDGEGAPDTHAGTDDGLGGPAL